MIQGLASRTMILRPLRRTIHRIFLHLMNQRHRNPNRRFKLNILRSSPTRTESRRRHQIITNIANSRRFLNLSPRLVSRPTRQITLINRLQRRIRITNTKMSRISNRTLNVRRILRLLSHLILNPLRMPAKLMPILRLQQLARHINNNLRSQLSHHFIPPLLRSLQRLLRRHLNLRIMSRHPCPASNRIKLKRINTNSSLSNIIRRSTNNMARRQTLIIKGQLPRASRPGNHIKFTRRHTVRINTRGPCDRTHPFTPSPNARADPHPNPITRLPANLQSRQIHRLRTQHTTQFRNTSRLLHSPNPHRRHTRTIHSFTIRALTRLQVLRYLR